MSCRISLITIEQIAEWVDMALNLDDNKVVRNIIIAQDLFIKPILCKDLYEELCAQVESGTVTSDFQLLLDNIVPCLSFRVYSRYLNVANLDSTEKGFRTWKEDNSDVISEKRLSSLIAQADQDADSYETALKVFLQANKECFSPFYDNCGCDNSSYSGFSITSIGRAARKPRIQEVVNNDLLDHQ